MATCPQALWYNSRHSPPKSQNNAKPGALCAPSWRLASLVLSPGNERAFSRNEVHCAIRLKILPHTHVLMSQSHPSRFWLLLVAGTIDIRTPKRFWPKWTTQACSSSKVSPNVRPTIWGLDQHPRPYSSANDWVVFLLFFHKSTTSLQKKLWR